MYISDIMFFRREDLIGFLCGRSPPHRNTLRPTSSLQRSSDDTRLQTFRDAVTLNGKLQYYYTARERPGLVSDIAKSTISLFIIFCLGH